MKRIAIAEARASLGDLVREADEKGERVKITRYGRTRAWLISAKDAQKLPSNAGDDDTGEESDDADDGGRSSTIHVSEEQTRIFRVRRLP